MLLSTARVLGCTEGYLCPIHHPDKDVFCRMFSCVPGSGDLLYCGFLWQRSCLVCCLRCAHASPRPRLLTHFRLPAWSSIHAWLLCLRTGSDFATERLPTPDPVLHMSALVRRRAVADTRLGLP